MNRRIPTVRVAAIVGAVTLISCSSTSGDSDQVTNPAVTVATFPDVVDSGATPETQVPTTPTTPSTSLVASDSADLPTGSPEELATAQPTPGPTGPLVVPTLEFLEIGEFESPVELTSRDLDGRSFVVEQGGRILAVDDLSSDVVLDITDLTSGDGERGLLGAAFHPAQDLAYAHYNDATGTSVLAEFEVDPVTAVFDRASQRVVLTVEQPFGNHNGGEIAFGPDGYLYMGLGDGGAANDPERNSLLLTTRLGKILRIDPRQAGDEPFTIPADNPFVDTPDADPTIWSLGLRNPWKFSFDAATGDLWIADVGQGEFEEIDFAPAINGQGAGRGLSFGWSAFEGEARFNEDQSPDGHTAPILTYSHDDGGCSVSGGAVYRGAAVPDLVGWYVYGDFCTGQIWGYDPTSGPREPVVVEFGQIANLAAIAVGGEDELYAVSTAGGISRFVEG